MSLKIWTSQDVSPGVPLGSILNVNDSDLVRDASNNPLTTLPAADGSYSNSYGLATSYYSTAAKVAFMNAGNWDSIKDFKIAGDGKDLGGRILDVCNYVHVDVELWGNKDVTMTIDGVKRGAFVTGSGDDDYTIGVTSNGVPGWSETFRVETNGGHDQVTFQSATDGCVVNSPYANQYNDGHTTSILADLGSGNDFYESDTLGAANTVNGGSGNDCIATGWGMDVISGDSGSDKLMSGDNDDTVDGGSGNDWIEGGNGNDCLIGGGGSGDDTIYGGQGIDTIDAGSGTDLCYGGTEGDYIYGGSGADHLYGEDGDDFITGDSGSDMIWGGNGADSLNGGAGSDDMWGGSGMDTFIYDAAGSGSDHIYDFDASQDFIDVIGVGITLAMMDSNNDGHVDALDAKASLSGGDLKLSLTPGGTVVLHGITSVDNSHFYFA